MCLRAKQHGEYLSAETILASNIILEEMPDGSDGGDILQYFADLSHAQRFKNPTALDDPLFAHARSGGRRGRQGRYSKAVQQAGPVLGAARLGQATAPWARTRSSLADDAAIEDIDDVEDSAEDDDDEESTGSDDDSIAGGQDLEYSDTE